MKIKYIAAIYSVLILFAVVPGLHTATADAAGERDMVAYYEQRTLVIQQLELGTDTLQLEEAYECSILLITDENYESILNEQIKQGAVILDMVSGEQYIGKVIWNSEYTSYQELVHQLLEKYMLLCVFLLLAGYLFMGLMYRSMVSPFRKLQVFTSEIAKGNLDLPLPMEQNNFFGAFTESFDIMREELKKAKESEYQANRSKKELVAELSHDIKTPIATINATCELLQVKERNCDTLDKVNVIANKAEMIDRLVSNLFHATLEDLQVLKVEVTEESSRYLTSMFGELKFYGEIKYENEVPECLLYMDKLRLQQVIDNIVNNAYKYAGTPVTVSFQETGDGILIQIKDGGSGVPEEELVLVTEKYFRGSNAKGKAGSGLGLYLAGVFLNQMHGGLECYNDHGFTVVLYLKKVG